MGEYEKAKAFANDQSALTICKEVLLPLATIGEERARYQGEEIMALLSNLRLAISGAVALRPAVSDSEYGKQILLSVINLYETIFVDGRCGRWHWDIGDLYLTLSHRAEEIDTVLDYFDKGFDHCKEYQRICSEEEYSYSAPLVSNLKSLTKGELPPIGQDFWKKRLKFYPQNICDELRKNPKYAECFV